MDQAMIYALTVLAAGLPPAGEANMGQAQRQANARANVETLEGSELLRQNLNTQMTNVGELRPAIFTGHVLSAERDGGVLYAPAQPDNPTFRVEVSAIIGMPCDYFDARADTPSVDLMNDYDAVFTGVNDACADNELFGDRLADYVDGGGKVILGQSTLPTQGNYFSGEIMTEAHRPATASSYTYSGTYQGAGVQCEHVLGPVVAYDTQYRDLASAISGATSDGTFDDGLPAVIWRSDRGVHYSAGNLGGQYSTGDWAQLTANMVICTDARLVGACCDPYTGICTDDVEVMECLPPLEFHLQETCADLVPPCGNPGACCEDISGHCVHGEFELNCDGTRFAAGALCDDFDPPCGEMLGACCCGPEGEEGICEPYECIADMTNSACLAYGEQTSWHPDESCDAAPPYDCGAPTYCDGSGGCGEYISRVLLPHDGGTIDNETGCMGYGDYTDTVALMSMGMSYDLSVWNGYLYSGDETMVWIDWNGDKDWYDDGEFIGTVVGQPQSDFVILVPPMAIPDYTRMRIRIDRYPPAPPYEPCGSTTHGEVEDYTILVSGEMPTGACCGPYTGDCADDVEVMDCLPPLQFHWEQTCASLDPPCGNPGACCDDIGDACTDGVLELNCAGTRFAPVPATCAEFVPPCGDLDFTFVFDPGTGPPPPTLCGHPMTDFPLDDSSAVYADVTSIPSPCVTGGEIQFSTPVSHRRIGMGWATWSHGYTEDVYFTNDATEITITLPPASMCGFYMYVGPNPFAEHTFKLIANGVIESEEFTAHGSAGAAYAGACGAALETITVECTSGVDFAVGEFGIGCLCEPMYVACCDELTGACTDGLDVLTCIDWGWRWDLGVEFCDDLVPACGEVTAACCVGAAGEPPYDPYECIADMTVSDCLAAGEQSFWAEGESCEGPVPYGCGAPGLLYAPTQPDDPGFRADVEAFIGKTVDYFDARVATPTLEELQEYIAVFTWVNYPYADKVAMGDVLADYVDAGGIVILGQWCLPTAGNYLSGRIMTEGYCPATASFYSSDSYAGDGDQCPTMGVDSFSSNYFDQVTAAEGAWSDGTTYNDYDFVCFRPSMNILYSPGNTGLDYTSGDVVRLTANMYACGTYWRTACCHPTEYDPATGAGVCEDDVDLMDCLPPLQFHWEQTCAGLHPPCGNPGACCDDALGQCSIELELNCFGRFLPGAECEPDPFDPPCGEYLPCQHSITMWDDYGDGWNGGYIDVDLNGELILAGLTLDYGSGPETVYFEAETCDTIETVWTPGGWPYEASYCIYGGFGGELGCDGLGGAEPVGIAVTGFCGGPTGACCLGYDGCVVVAEGDCAADYLGDCTDCGDMADCDSDGMTDLCAIAVYEAEDCNENGIPDECDIAAGTSEDDNGDGIPDECTVVIPLDIKPGSCPNPLNRGSHGVLPVALVGMEDFDVTGIDISSVRLRRADGVGGEVAPHEGPPGPHSVFEDVATPFEGEPCDCHELAGDGIVDLSMKFKTDDVVEALLLDDLPAGALVELVVSGYLLEGTPFEASDCIRLVPPGTSSGMLSVESNVAGAWIDVSPPDETLDGGGLADFERSFPLTTVVTLTAEPEAQGRPFVGWLVNGVRLSGSRSSSPSATSYQRPVGNVIKVTILENEVVKAVYAESSSPTMETGMEQPGPEILGESEPGIGSGRN